MGKDRDREETFDCAACGAEVSAEAQLCPNCGRRLGDPIEPEEPVNLTPEQARRINDAKRNKTIYTSCVLIGLFVIASWLIDRTWNMSPSPREQATAPPPSAASSAPPSMTPNSTPLSPTTPPGNATSGGASSSHQASGVVLIGEAGSLVMPGNQNAVPVAPTADVLHQFIEATTKHDDIGAAEAYALFFSVPYWTKALNLGPTGFLSGVLKIRILEGEHLGDIGYVPMAWLQP